MDNTRRRHLQQENKEPKLHHKQRLALAGNLSARVVWHTREISANMRHGRPQRNSAYPDLGNQGLHNTTTGVPVRNSEPGDIQATPRHHDPEHQTDQWSHYRLVLNTELNTVSSRLFFGHDRGLANIPQSPLQRKGHLSQALPRRRLHKGATDATKIHQRQQWSETYHCKMWGP